MTRRPSHSAPSDPDAVDQPEAPGPRNPQTDSEEVGGPKGPEPTRYGDWEKNGRCIDF